MLNIKKNDKGIKNCIFSKNIKKNHPKASYHIVLLGLKKDQNSLIEATEATIFSEEYLYSSEQKTKIIQKLKDIGFAEEELNHKLSQCRVYFTPFQNKQDDAAKFLIGCKLTALVVDTVDRLQRTFNEFPMLLELVKKGKLALHFFKGGLVIDKNFKSSDLAMWQMQILSANMFVNSTRDNVRRSEERMLKEGLLPGPAPIGYLNVRDEKGKKTIIIDPERGPIIKKLFEEYSTGLFSMDELVKKSKQWGLKNRKSGNPMTKSQFASVLQNPFYYGVMFYNKTFFPHIYEKLISKELFDKCTEIRTGKFKRTSKHTKEPYIFRGLVRCKHCGCLLSPYTKKDKYVYLRHTDLKNCEHCSNVSEKVLLKDVEKHLSSIHFDDNLKAALAVRLKKQYEATHGNTYYQLEKNRNELADVEENQKKLLDLLIAGAVSAEVYRSKNAEYEAAKIELQAKIEKLQMPDTSVERLSLIHI